jgi:hypothetical protein
MKANPSTLFQAFEMPTCILKVLGAYLFDS